MKLYDNTIAPNPRRVRIALAEKGQLEQVELINVDIFKGEQNTKEFRSKNPFGGVPVLELDNGDVITESVSINRYFEEKFPENPLFGTTAEEKAKIDMWHRRIESSVLGSIGTYFHHATDGLGESNRYRNKEWGEYNVNNLKSSLNLVEDQLKENDYIAGEHYSIVDITLLCSVDFGLFLKLIDLENYPAIKNWYERVSQRPSSGA